MIRRFFFKYLIDIDTFISGHIYEQKISKKYYRKIYSSLLRSQPIIKFFIICHFIFFKIFTLSLNNNKLKFFVLSLLFKFNIFQFNKILQLVFAIRQLSLGSDENVLKIKFNNTDNKKDFYDNIVIGSGPSGCITGLKLSKAGFETLLIEKGNKYTLPKYKHPLSEFQKKWKYTGISGALGNYDFQYASGECVGGGSEINSGLYHELDDVFLENLKKNNLNNLIKKKKFEWEYLLSNEDNEDSSFEQKNLKNYFFEGAKKLNLKLENLNIFFKNKKKNSMSKTILEDAIKLGCKIQENTEVVKIKKENNWVIETKKNGTKKKLFAKRIFLCCGAPYSFKLMKNSGYIKKNFNQMFHFHPMIKIIAKFPQKVNSSNNVNVVNTQISEYYPDFLFGNAASNLEFLKIFAFGNNRALSDIDKNFEYMSMFHVTFSLGSSSFIDLPMFDESLIKYKLSDNDIKIVTNGFEKLINFTFECGAEYIYIQDQKISKISLQSDIKKIVSNYKFNFSSVHLLGGFKFGESNDAILNSYGKIKNKKLDGLYINDSSLLTEKLLKNPQGAIMSISSQNIEQAIKYINE
jgi:hypothetical protein